MRDRLFFHKVAIIGVGFIGASLSLALRKNNLCRHICGFGRSEERLREAHERAIIDEYSLDVRASCDDADLIVLCTPVGTFREITARMRSSLKKGALVTDVGSVKGDLVRDIEQLMPEGVFYIAAHPIAGSEQSGIDAAQADLFRSARCIVTPTEKSEKAALASIRALWESVGASVELMSPGRHDEIYAAVSHLPHLVAYALMNTIGTADPEYIDYAGQGFRDTTRIALSSPELWRDISLLNRAHLLDFMQRYRAQLEKLEMLIKNSDPAGIDAEFSKARELRMKISAEKIGNT